MSLARIYLRIQIVILVMLGGFVFHKYQTREPVTRFLVDATWKVVAHKTGFCSESCYHAWRVESMKSAETQKAIGTLVRWVAGSPRLARFFVARISESDRKHLIMVTTLSSATPEASALFESHYGISPMVLQKLLIQ